MTSRPTHTHPNARLTPLGRERLLRRHIDHGENLAFLAAQSGISVRSAYKWLARYRSGGAAALTDRRRVRRTERRTLDSQHLQRAVDLRHERCTLRRVVRMLAAPLSTVARALNRLGLGRLRNLDPKPPVQRYERERPGDLIHIDDKKLARFRKVGHRITGNRQQGRSAGVGYDRVHVAIDDATRLADVEVLPDEKQATTVGFLLRAVAWFDGQGISCERVLSGNSSAYRSKPWQEACSTLGLTPKRTRPYIPRTNVKAERFIKTLLTEWAYSMAFRTAAERNHWLPRCLAIDNGRRCHMALAGRTPNSAARAVAGYLMN